MTREQRTNQAVTKGIASIAGVLLIALVFGGLTSRLTSEFVPDGFIRGLSFGGFVGLLIMCLRIYRTLDEYGQRLHQRAASLAFLITMLSVTVTFPLQIALGFTCPLWVIYAHGMATWGICIASIAIRDTRGA